VMGHLEQVHDAKQVRYRAAPRPVNLLSYCATTCYGITTLQ
jgi:hypothetical protein